MRYRNPRKESDFFSMIDHQQEVINIVKGINKLNGIIEYQFLSELIELFNFYTPFLCSPVPAFSAICSIVKTQKLQIHIATKE